MAFNQLLGKATSFSWKEFFAKKVFEYAAALLGFASRWLGSKWKAWDKWINKRILGMNELPVVKKSDGIFIAGEKIAGETITAGKLIKPLVLQKLKSEGRGFCSIKVLEIFISCLKIGCGFKKLNNI